MSNYYDIIKQLKIYKDKSNQVVNYLVSGPSGTGKTTLIKKLNEVLETELVYINASTITTKQEMINIITSLDSNCLLFIDEIHLLNKKFYEVFYNMMEDGFINVLYNFEEITKSVTIELPTFIFCCATTESHLLPIPFQQRFDKIIILDFITPNHIKELLSEELPSITNILIDEIIDVVDGSFRNLNKVIKQIKFSDTDIDSLYDNFQINHLGLNQFMVKYIEYLKVLDTTSLAKMASMLGLPQKYVLNNLEPYLLRKNLIEITSRGRKLTKNGIMYEANYYSIK